MEEFLDYLISEYGQDSPFSLKDIDYKNYSLPWVCKMLQKLCLEEKVSRFSSGWYYIPSVTELGRSYLNPQKRWGCYWFLLRAFLAEQTWSFGSNA